MSCAKWTTSSAKASLYNKYRAEWLQIHDFDFICIYKKFNEYLQKNNLEASESSFESFQDECCDANTWMQFWDWESEILIPQVRDGLMLLIDDSYDFMAVTSEAYLCSFHGDVDICIEIEDWYEKSIPEIIYDIAMLVVNHEYGDDEIKLSSRLPRYKDKLPEMIDKIIYDACEAVQ